MKTTNFASQKNCSNVFLFISKLLVFVLVLASLSQAATRTVYVGQNNLHNFVDAASGNNTTTINAGDTVQWNWVSGFHSSTSGTCSGTCTADATWDSGSHSAPNTFNFTFNSAGTFPYFCSIHLASMTGKVIVNPVVTNTNDSGPGSLRQAILDVNADPDLTTITFNIPGTGVQTISLLSPLPAITNPVLLDGESQPGWSANNPLIELNGIGAGGADGLVLQAGNTTVRGLVINRFGLNGIRITGNGNTITGNFIGTNAAGSAASANNQSGILVLSSNNTIGGTAAGSANLLSGNSANGIEISGGSSNLVQGNLIGTDVNSTAPIGNHLDGVRIDSSAANNIIGGSAAGSANIVANNQKGVVVAGTTSTGNAIEGNSISSSTILGIDLNDDGVTFNTPGGPHTGPNNLQNYPVLSTASACDETTINGALNSTPNTTFRVEFFSSPACSPSAHGEGQLFLGSQMVTTDDTGNVSFNAILAAASIGGQSVTATATDPNGNTSEFSQCITADYMISGANGRNLRVRLGKPFTLVVASFNDQDPHSSASHFAGTTINWGDGTPPSPAMVVSAGGQNYNVIGSHVYNRIGGWNVTVTINDSGGFSGSVTSQVRLWPRPFSY